MQKTKRRILYAAMVAVLVVLQLSNALIALADSKTALKVSDVGDEKLYALLAAAADYNGNNGGILYKEDAQNLKNIALNSSNLYSTANKVKSYDKLSELCPNLTSINESGNVSSSARDSFIKEVAKLDKLESINVYVEKQEQLDSLFNKEGRDNVTYLSVYLRGQSVTYDISGLSALSNLSYLDISNSYSNADIKGIDVITSVSKLNSLVLNGYFGDIYQDIIDRLPVTLDRLRMEKFDYYSSGNTVTAEASVDLSRLTQLSYVYLDGFNSVTGLDKLTSDNGVIVQIMGNRKTKLNFSSISDKVIRLHLYNCILEDGTSISKVPANVEYLTINNCGVTDINVGNAKNLRELSLSGNGLNSMSDISGLSEKEIRELDVSNNKITDISAIAGFSNMYYFNASCNDIETLPDLSSLDRLVGGRYTSTQKGYELNNDYYRLSLAGNKLTKDAIKGKVPEGCENDIYWMYSATSLSTESGQVYYPELDTTLVSRYVECDRNTIYTSQKEFTFDEELVKYLKGLDDDKYGLYINYIDNDVVSDNVTIYPGKLSDDTKNFTVSFDSTECGTSNKELDEAFLKYGEIEKYYVSNGKKDSGIEGVTYGTANVSLNLKNKSEQYHEYIYDPESRTFAYVNTLTGNSTARLENNENTKGMIYFFVPDSKDSFMNTYLVKCNDGIKNYTRTYNCYAELNDDVINGKLLISSHSLKNYNSAYLEAGSKVDISKDVVSKLKNNKAYISFNICDKTSSDGSTISARLSSGNLKEQDIKTTLPTMTKKAGSKLEIPFAGGEPDYVYDIDNTADSNGISYTFRVNSESRLTNELGNNIYKVVGQTYIPLQIGNWGYSMSVPDGVKEQVFVIAAAKDQYMKAAVVEDGTYKGKHYSYLNKVDSDEIKKLVNASIDSKTGCTINILADKVEITDDIIKLIKTKETAPDDHSSRGILTFRFMNTNTGDYDSEAVISNNSFRNKNITAPVIIKKPEVEVSATNAEFDKLISAESQAVYVKSDIDTSTGIHYYANKKMLNNMFGSDVFTLGGYHVFVIDNKGTLRKTDYTNSYNSVPLHFGYAAYIQEAKYVTPSDTPTKPEATTKAPEVTTPEATTKVPEVTTPETTTKVPEVTTPEATTKVTEVTTPEATTKAPEVTTPEATTKVPEVTTPEATTKVPEVTTPEATTKVPEVTTPEATTKVPEVTTPETTTKAPEVTTPEATTKKPESTKPGEGGNSGEITTPDTDGKNVAPEVIDKEDIIDAAKVNNDLIDSIVDSKLSEIKVTSAQAPELNSNVFAQMKSRQKDITVGVTDADNRLQYQWKFNSDTVTQTNMDIDLSIKFDTDRTEAVKEITGRDDVMYLSFAHHGELPGPATIKTYVGNQYKDGDIVYLYYYNEEENRVESVGGVNQGLVVKNGYVEYTITHCSLYFLSTAMAADVNAVEPDNNTQGSEVVPVPDKVNDTIPTGDARNVVSYMMVTITALAVIGGVLVYNRRKRI